MDVRLASTTAARGHSWRGDHHPLFETKQQQKQNTYHGVSHPISLSPFQCPSYPINCDIQEPHISLPNFSKPQEEGARDGREGPRTSVRKSNLKVPSGGVRLVGLSHTARNNAMV